MSSTLLRSAVVDDDLLNSVKHLVIEDAPLVPEDLWKIELAIRALVLADDLHILPHLEDHRSRSEKNADLRLMQDIRAEANPPAIGDHVLDYEFVLKPHRMHDLPLLSVEELFGLERVIEQALASTYKKDFRELTLPEIRGICSEVPLRFVSLELDTVVAAETEPPSPDEAEFCDEDMDALAKQGVKEELLNAITMYGVALVRFERLGATVFSQTSIGQACHRYMFASYPHQLFTSLDERWTSILKRVLGPGIGVTVPPLLACVLSRVTKRNEISHAIRDLREEYGDSRRSLWDYLENMWHAPTLKKQLRMLEKLDKATEGLFEAAFPERCRFLETAWSATLSLADMKPLSAIGDIGKEMLKRDKHAGAVAAIGFTRQLSSDLRRIAGLNTLLPKVLSRVERANFALI